MACYQNVHNQVHGIQNMPFFIGIKKKGSKRKVNFENKQGTNMLRHQFIKFHKRIN
jgi:hypothetical protein